MGMGGLKEKKEEELGFRTTEMVWVENYGQKTKGGERNSVKVLGRKEGNCHLQLPARERRG